jgi:pimeloyl-ACP methyl ester carboxylesterase
VNGLGQIYRKDEVFIRELSEISTPTLIVWGENDRTVPVSSAELFRQRIPDSSIRMFPQCAHSVPLEVPAELCDAIVQFHQH